MALRRKTTELFIPFEKDGRRGSVSLVGGRLKVRFPERVFRRALRHFLTKKRKAMDPAVQQEETRPERRRATTSLRFDSSPHALIRGMKSAALIFNITVLWEGKNKAQNTRGDI
jgi:hypothetical protein